MNNNISKNNLPKDTVITKYYYTGKYSILNNNKFIPKKIMNILMKEKYAVLDRVQWGNEFYVLVKDYNAINNNGRD